MKKFYLLSFIIFQILILGFGCSTQKNNIQNIVYNSSATPTQTKKEKIIINNNIKNCKKDLDCFKDASKTCQLSKVRNSYTVNTMGINLNFDDYYEIKGSVDNKCLLYIKTNNLTTEYSEDIKKLLLNQGMTEEQIKEYENAGNEEAKTNYNGKDGFCFFNYNDDLKILIEHWQINDYSSLDITNLAKCFGNLFVTSTIQ